jgi:hypothetical protein
MGNSIQGQMLRRSARREVAIYLRGGVLWVADFIDGDGRIVDVATWIRFNCGSASTYQARRRMICESAFPVSRELSMRIERLHHATEAVASDRVASVTGDSTATLRSRFGHAVRRIFRRRARFRPPLVSS